MYRRQFFASLAKASIDMLGANPFYGSLENAYYTFVPSRKRDCPTILVVALRLKEEIYLDDYNIISMDKWPQNPSVQFWRKLLLRHDLTDELYVMCKQIPSSPPSFMRKAICISSYGKGFRAAEYSPVLPVLLIMEPNEIEDMPSLEGFAPGSDVFVTHPNGLNIKESPAYSRLRSFFTLPRKQEQAKNTSQTRPTDA